MVSSKSKNTSAAPKIAWPDASSATSRKKKVPQTTRLPSPIRQSRRTNLCTQLLSPFKRPLSQARQAPAKSMLAESRVGRSASNSSAKRKRRSASRLKMFCKPQDTMRLKIRTIPPWRRVRKARYSATCSPRHLDSHAQWPANSISIKKRSFMNFRKSRNKKKIWNRAFWNRSK